jgi:diguanylate cyclase
LREERIIEASAQRDEWRRLYEKIGQLLFDNGLQPSPENFDICHRYLIGAERELIGLVDKAIRREGRLTQSAISAITAQCGGLSGEDLNRMAGDARGLVEQVTAIVAKSGDDARDYGAALQSTDLAVAGPTKAMETLVELTRTMIGKAQAAEDELRRTETHIKSLHDDLATAHRTANSDPLTGLPNRRALDHHLRQAVENAKRSATPVSIAICDIDHFKLFNDTHGHQIGDEVIKFVGASLSRAGTENFVARYGGEEFVVIFERCSPQDASLVLDRVRAAIASRELKVTNTGQSLGKLSFSGGIAALEAQDSPVSILRRADAALYRAKEAGRNRVLIAEPGDRPAV